MLTSRDDDGAPVFTILRFSEPREKIAAAIVEAHKKMGAVRKTKTAVVGEGGKQFKYSFADLATVYDAVMDAYHDAGIAVLQPAAVTYGEQGALANVECFLLHESGQWARAALMMRPTTTSPQAVGSALTYGKRYGILGMSGLAPEEDDDGKKASVPPARPTPAPRNRVISKADLKKFDQFQGKLDEKEQGDLIERVTANKRKPAPGVRKLEQIFETERADVWVALLDRIKALSTEIKVAGETQEQPPAEGAPAQ